jgi:hypothetical protein
MSGIGWNVMRERHPVPVRRLHMHRPKRLHRLVAFVRRQLEQSTPALSPTLVALGFGKDFSVLCADAASASVIARSQRVNVVPVSGESGSSGAATSRWLGIVALKGRPDYCLWGSRRGRRSRPDCSRRLHYNDAQRADGFKLTAHCRFCHRAAVNVQLRVMWTPDQIRCFHLHGDAVKIILQHFDGRIDRVAIRQSGVSGSRALRPARRSNRSVVEHSSHSDPPSFRPTT